MRLWPAGLPHGGEGEVAEPLVVSPAGAVPSVFSRTAPARIGEDGNKKWRSEDPILPRRLWRWRRSTCRSLLGRDRDNAMAVAGRTAM